MSNLPNISPQTKIHASDEIISSKLDNEVVMMSIEKGAYYGLDEIGARVWELLAEPRTVSGICDILVQEYDVAREQCEQDMLAWFAELAGENLIQIADEPTE